MDLTQLNENQKTTLKKFREAIKDCLIKEDSDIYLLRWLIARDFDVAKAEKMLRASLEWRKLYRVDHILQEFKAPEVLLKYFPSAPIGFDKFHNPLWVVRYGRADMKGILSSCKKKDYLLHIMYMVETSFKLATENLVKNQPDKVDKILAQSTIIFDMEEFSIRHITNKAAMDIAIQFFQMLEANYPELLRKVFVINAPKIFSMLASILSPLMHQRTVDKFSIFAHEPDVWKPAILSDVDPDQLPKMYGGTMTDPDGNPHCLTKVNMGGTVPKSYYFSNQAKFDTSNKKSVSVGRGSKEHLEFKVDKPNSIIKWEFHCDDGDIAFAVYLKKGNEMTAVVPHERVDCLNSAEEGEIPCEETGLYIVEFDNTYSYIKGKKIWYAINVESASATKNALD